MQVQKHGGLNARLISHKSSYDGRSLMVFPSDILLQSSANNATKRKEGCGFDKEEIYSLFRDADVIHCHNYFTDLYIFRLFPELIKYTREKLVAIQFHSSRLSLKNVEKDIKHKNMDYKCVVAQYQVRQFPEATPVPNAIPIDDEYFTPIDRDPSNRVIVYSPSNTTLGNWNNKGYPETMAAFKRINTPCETLIITNTPHNQCLQKKQIGDIAVDEIMTGSYHLNTLEAMSQGQIAICGLDSLCNRAINEYTQSDSNPIVVAKTSVQLSNVLNRYLNDDAALVAKQEESRNFMEKYWSEEYINAHFKKFYDGKL